MKNLKSLVKLKKGDVLNIANDNITIDVEETKKREKEIKDLTKDI